MMNNLQKKGNHVIVIFIVLIILNLSCSTINSLFSSINSDNTIVSNIPIMVTDTYEINEFTKTPTNTEIKPENSCQIPDNSFCKFMLTLEPLINSNNIAEILNYAKIYNCNNSQKELCYGVTKTDCILTGTIESEGGCATKSQMQEYWNSVTNLPINIKGIVYPQLPNSNIIGKTGMDAYEGPVIIISPNWEDPDQNGLEFDWLLFCKKYSSVWMITAIDRIILASEDWLIPSTIIIPWK